MVVGNRFSNSILLKQSHDDNLNEAKNEHLIQLRSLAETPLSTISFNKDDIAKIIKNLNPNKAHGFDMIRIWMLKICGDSILKPLALIIKSCIESGNFPIEWKKANVVQFIKK